jgi:hypothetical protein
MANGHTRHCVQRDKADGTAAAPALFRQAHRSRSPAGGRWLRNLRPTRCAAPTASAADRFLAGPPAAQSRWKDLTKGSRQATHPALPDRK